MTRRADLGVSGDRNDVWRSSYSLVRKDLLASTDESNRRRLVALGASSLPATGTWLDLGAGDGNLVPSLHRLGVISVIAVDVQSELLAECDTSAYRLVGSAESLPLRRGSVDVAIAMDVLHHLAPDLLDVTLGGLHRIVRAGGWLMVCEPAPTPVRTGLEALLMSPLAGLSEFSRQKRRMVMLEADTLEPWLHHERDFVGRAAEAGFALEHEVRRPLHTLRRFRRR